MSDQPDPRAQQIAALEAALKLPLPESTLAQIAQDLRALREAAALLGDLVAGDKVGGDKVVGDKIVDPQGTVSNDGRIDGVAVGVNLGTIIYGRTPQEEERRRLVWYLDRLANKLYRLPLRGLEERLDQGKGVALPQVYVMLATKSEIDVARGQVEALRQYLDLDGAQLWFRKEYHPEWTMPLTALTAYRIPDAPTERVPIPEDGFPSLRAGVEYSLQTETEILLNRACLATEAVYHHKHLVLLGDPGSGKSTFLRHLAWALARRGLDQHDEATALFGWENNHWLLPILIPVRTLAGRLARDGISDATVYAVLRDELQSYNISLADDMLSEALHRGAVLLLFDGLDEVPFTAIFNQTIDRYTVLRAVRNFARLHAQAAIILTCRTRAFDEALRADLGWPVETIAPFTLGQIRHFIPAWYRELVEAGQIESTQADRLTQRLIDTIVTSPKLRTMAENPLLLTMMALVLYNKGELPRDRPQLYERILELLLGQWDKVREGQSLAEAIGQPDWGSERIRPLLDRLSFEAHAGAASVDGRGRLTRRAVREALERYLIQAGMRDDQSAAASVRCLDYFNQRSGLLVPDDAQDSYTFAHLTLQEHCAGRALVLDLDASSLIMSHRVDDRWREPIFLGLGVVQQTNPTLIDRVLSDLIDMDEDGQPKSVERWQRDLILAAEIGQDRDWGFLRAQRVNVDRFQRDLRRGLVELLGDKAQPLPVDERVRAGFLLGDLGDPRFPVKIEEWQRELAKVQIGDTSGYFCRIEAGDYIIGSADDDPDANDVEKPQHTVTLDAPFWIARYPITNAQWRVWINQGGRTPYYAVENTDLNHPNQPVVSVPWDWCNDFCAWFSAQLGMTVRLPTEFEWEAAARGGDARCYPWGDVWRADHAATEEDQDIRSWRWSVSVGCYSAGVAPCGAFDMAGNVWEWTASEWRSYPAAQNFFTEGGRHVLRGGAWSSRLNRVRCGARSRNYSDFDFDSGFRIVVIPQFEQ